MGIKSVTLSFDDGVQQDIRFVELLNKYGPIKGLYRYSYKPVIESLNVQLKLF